MVMRHSRATFYLEAYAPDELTPQIRTRLESHLADCASCASRAQETATFQAFLGQTAAVALPVGFDDAVEAVRRWTLREVRTAGYAGGPVGAFLRKLSARPVVSSFAVAGALVVVLLLKGGAPDNMGLRRASSAPIPTIVQASTSYKFTIARNGPNVQIEWPANGKAHRVRKGSDPISIRAAADRVVMGGKTYVEPAAGQTPGSVTYYLID